LDAASALATLPISGESSLAQPFASNAARMRATLEGGFRSKSSTEPSLPETPAEFQIGLGKACSVHLWMEITVNRCEASIDGCGSHWNQSVSSPSNSKPIVSM